MTQPGPLGSTPLVAPEHVVQHALLQHRSRTAVGYLRRSTDRQEQSIPDQRLAVERYCAQFGLVVARFYVDDAISGASAAGRRAFQAMISDARGAACDFAYIVVYDVKRFGRTDNDEAGHYRYLLRTCGVEVRYATENFVGDGTDDLLRPVKQWQAREESRDLAKVSIRGLLSKSGTGSWMGGVPPHGFDLRYQNQGGEFILQLRYNRDGSKQVLDSGGHLIRTLCRGESIAVSRRDSCRLVLGDPVRVEAVRRIFRMYVEDRFGIKRVADALNKDRVPTARDRAWSGHASGQWSQSAVRDVLVHPAYCGDMVWNRRTDARFFRIEHGRAVERRGVLSRRLEFNEKCAWVIVRDAHPAIVPRSRWEAAQKRLASQPASAAQRGINQRTVLPARAGPAAASGPRSRFLLSGLCSCARCGSTYEGYTQRGTARLDGERARQYSYACGGYIRRGPSVCGLGRVAQAWLERRVGDVLVERYAAYSGPDGADRLAQAARVLLEERHAKARRMQAEARRRLEQVMGTIRALLDNITPTNRAMVDERLVELATERARLERESESVPGAEAPDMLSPEQLEEAAASFTDLRCTLHRGTLDRRQAAVRRCIRRVWIDHPAGTARLELLLVPGVADGPVADVVIPLSSAASGRAHG